MRLPGLHHELRGGNLAVKLVLPGPTKVTVLPLTVATAGLLLLKVNDPLPLEAGAANANAGSP